MSTPGTPGTTGTATPAPEKPASTEGTPKPVAGLAPLAPAAASYSQILAACKGCQPKERGEDAQFITDQLEAGATLAQASSAWMETLSARAEHARTEADTAKAQASKPGHHPLPEGKTKRPAATASVPGASAEASSEFDALVAELVEAGVDRREAVRRVATTHEDLYLAELGLKA